MLTLWIVFYAFSGSNWLFTTRITSPRQPASQRDKADQILDDRDKNQQQKFLFANALPYLAFSMKNGKPCTEIVRPPC